MGSPIGRSRTTYQEWYTPLVHLSSHSYRYWTDESAGMHMGVPAMTIETMVSFSSAALLAFLRVVKRQVEFYGWDGPMWNAWHLNAIRIFGRLELGAANSSS